MQEIIRPQSKPAIWYTVWPRISITNGRCLLSHYCRFHIVILDDTDRVSTASILAELLTAMEYHGPTNPLWIDAVYGRDGVMLYPAGYYYLKRKCYFIATRTQARWVEIGQHRSLLLHVPAFIYSLCVCMRVLRRGGLGLSRLLVPKLAM